jgi:polyisoprenoid-binding protein YceI
MKTVKHKSPFFLLVFLAPLVAAAGNDKAPAPAGSGVTYKITPVFSNVSFSIMKFFFKEEGGFRDYSGTVFYDPSNPRNSRVSMTVQAASIDTRNTHRDESLRSDDFFDADKYPTLSFSSTSVVAKRQGELEVTGDLTIHGITKRITVSVRFLGTKELQGWGNFAGFDAVFTIDRTAFGVNGSRWSGGDLILSKEVTIHLAIGGVKEPK